MSSTPTDPIWDYFQTEHPESFEAAAGRLRYLVRRMQPGDRVLDIGVGAGFLERHALERGVDIHCLDPSERTIARLRDELALSDKAMVGGGQEIPAPDGRFDAVVMSEVLEHLPDEVLSATLAEVQRVLRPDGTFLGTVPSAEDLTTELALCPCCGARFHRWGHVQSFDQERMHALLSDRFEVLELRSLFLVNWKALNWKGKLLSAVKTGLNRLGVHGGDERLFFRARRA